MVVGVLPAVVSITTRQIERDQVNRPVAARGLGSGVNVDRRGRILTNSHVVKRVDLEPETGTSDGLVAMFVLGLGTSVVVSWVAALRHG